MHLAQTTGSVETGEWPEDLADEPEDFSLDQGEIERLESSCADEGFLDRAELEE